MQRTYQFIAFTRDGDIFCASLQQPRIEDHQMEELGAELGRLIDEENCRLMVLNLGPEDPDCLFSIFMAKLVNLQRRLQAIGGSLALAHVSDDIRSLFHAAGIEKFFQFFPDQQSALQSLRSRGGA